MILVSQKSGKAVARSKMVYQRLSPAVAARRGATAGQGFSARSPPVIISSVTSIDNLLAPRTVIITMLYYCAATAHKISQVKIIITLNNTIFDLYVLIYENYDRRSQLITVIYNKIYSCIKSCSTPNINWLIKAGKHRMIWLNVFKKWPFIKKQ